MPYSVPGHREDSLTNYNYFWRHRDKCRANHCVTRRTVNRMSFHWEAKNYFRTVKDHRVSRKEKAI